METRALWLQEAVANRTVTVLKVRGDLNPADLFTKYLNREEIDGHLKRMGVTAEWCERRVSPAVKL